MRVILFLIIFFVVPLNCANALCVKDEATEKEYDEAYEKFGYSPGPKGVFSLEDAQIVEYIIIKKETAFKECVAKEENELKKKGQDRFATIPASNGMYIFDKITEKISIATPGGYRELQKK
jgi:hypothetical protein